MLLPEETERWYAGDAVQEEAGEDPMVAGVKTSDLKLKDVLIIVGDCFGVAWKGMVSAQIISCEVFMLDAFQIYAEMEQNTQSQVRFN